MGLCVYISIYIYRNIYTPIFLLFLSSELCPIPSDFGRTHHIYIRYVWKLTIYLSKKLLFQKKNNVKDVRFEALQWWNIDIVSVCGNTMCLSQLSWSWGTGSEKNLIAQLVSRQSLSEIMIQGRTNIGQLISQLSLSEKYGSGRTMGTSRVLLYVSISAL